MLIRWITKKEIRFCPLKDKKMYPSFKIYQGDLICKGDYISDAEQNVITCWGKHNTRNHNSVPLKY